MASATLNYSIPYPLDTDAVDVAGDIKLLADHLDNNLEEILSDNVGNMVSSNTEAGISVTYQDSDNTLDFEVNDFIISLSGDVSGSATVTALLDTDIPVSVSDDSHAHTYLTVSLNFEDLINVDSSGLSDEYGVFYNSASSLWTVKKPGTSLFPVETSLTLLSVSSQDSGSIIELTSSSAVTVTILNDVNGAFSGNETMSFIRKGSGTVSISPDSGVTINSLNGNTLISGQYGKATIYRTGTNEWILTGDLS